MRSSKSRSRSKSNRSRSMGNIVNRVFDSSGPEGKVRGTPQQIIDKYNQLARDAQLSNDRVAAENFQQHAEHYTRLLGEALREQEARREQQDSQGQNQGQQNQNRDRPRDQRDDDGQKGGAGQQDRQQQQRPQGRRDEAGDVIDMAEGGNADSGLVETPEEKPAPKRRRTKPRDAARSEDGTGDDQPQAPAAE